MLIAANNLSRKAICTSLIATLLLAGIVIAAAQTTTTLQAAPKNKVDLSRPLTISWRYDSNLTLNLTPAFDAARVYLPLAGGTIVSLMGANGQLNWRSEMGGELSASPVADQYGF